MKKYIVYKHTNIINSKCYIGYTGQGIIKRLNEHIKNANSGMDSHFYRAIRKYGISNFVSEILFETVDKDLVLEKEKYYIEYYGSFHNGYNMTLGSDGGYTLGKYSNKEMEEYLFKLSKRTSGENNPRYSGKSDDEIVEFYYNLYMKELNWRDRPFKKIAKEHNFPQSFSKCRFDGEGFDGLKKRILEKVKITNPEITEIKYKRTKEHSEKLSGTQFIKGFKQSEQPQNQKNKNRNSG